MSLTLRSLRGIAFAALLALSLVATASQAVADTRGQGLPNVFDQGFVDNAKHQHPIGRLGVTWE